MIGNLSFSNPLWYLFAAMLVAIAIAAALYYGSKGTILNKKWRQGLSILRFLGLFLIFLLLLKPLLRNNETKVLKPIVVVGIDNTQSIKKVSDQDLISLKGFAQGLSQKLDKDKYDIQVRNLGGKSLDDSLSFEAVSTNLGGFLDKVKDEFIGENLAHVILATDGINNKGLVPVNKAYGFEIHTLGLGDTTSKKDLLLTGITANKLAFMGNSFPVKVGVQSYLLKGGLTKLRVKSNGKTLAEQVVRLESNETYEEFTLNIQATEPGIQQLTIELLPLKGEVTTQNNQRTLLVEVVDGKEKVLVLGLNPHADLKAIRAILDKNKLLDTEVLNLQTSSKEEILKIDFDILVLHQLPDQLGSGESLLPQLLGRGKPVFFFLGGLSDLSRFNGMQEVLGISASGSKTDLVSGFTNPSFERFGLSESLPRLLSDLPPIHAPFGEYRILSGSESILLQKIGELETERPLLIVNKTKSRKAAVFTAEGLWKWRLEEFKAQKSQILVDDLIAKTFQLISVKEDKSKLRVYPSKKSFDVNERILLQNEAYNPLLERVYDVPINLTISGPKGYSKKLNYDIIEGSSLFELAVPYAGVYDFKATAEVLGKTEKSIGRFVVNKVNLEMLNTQADFNLLKTLAQNSGGSFNKIQDAPELIQLVNQDSEVVGKIFNTETLRALINLKWILPLIVLLFSLEWILRKYKGTY